MDVSGSLCLSYILSLGKYFNPDSVLYKEMDIRSHRYVKSVWVDTIVWVAAKFYASIEKQTKSTWYNIVWNVEIFCLHFCIGCNKLLIL